MKDCPPDAIRRSSGGEVSIHYDLCINCGNCANNCPYGVIRMTSAPVAKKTGLLSWFLFGFGNEPGEDKRSVIAADEGKKRPVKCDLCAGIKAPDDEPACVRACPTGAAFRVRPEEYLRSASSVANQRPSGQYRA